MEWMNVSRFGLICLLSSGLGYLAVYLYHNYEYGLILSIMAISLWVMLLGSVMAQLNDEFPNQ